MTAPLAGEQEERAPPPVACECAGCFYATVKLMLDCVHVRRALTHAADLGAIQLPQGLTVTV